MATPPDFSVGQVLTSATMNQVGLWRVTGGTLSSTSTNFQSCFTDDYLNYRIDLTGCSLNATGDIFFRFMQGSSAISTALYYWALVSTDTSGTTATGGFGALVNRGYTGLTNNGKNNVKVLNATMTIFQPKLAELTAITLQAHNHNTGYRLLSGGGGYDGLTAFDGIQFLTNAATTFNGTINIYGFNT